MMIRKRIKSKIRRLERQTKLREWLDDLRAEGTFQSVLRQQQHQGTEDEEVGLVQEYGMLGASRICFVFVGYHTHPPALELTDV